MDDRLETLLIHMTAILAVTYSLGRGRNGVVDDVIAIWSDDQLRRTLISDDHPAVGLWQAERNNVALIEDAFQSAVTFGSFLPPPRVG